MTRVYGGCIEPGGMLLDDDIDWIDCPDCKKPAVWRTWEACESGSINTYTYTRCRHCGYFEGDDPTDLY